MIHKVLLGDCEKELDSLKKADFFKGVHLTFLDPPFNQNKEYNHHNDNMPEEEYWAWMKRVIDKIYNITIKGGAIYFMQREKNTEYVLRTLRETGWTFQNLIAWNKLTSAIPSKYRFSKKYQIIAYCTKGSTPLTFNSLRYEPPLLAMHEYERETGIYVTDIWDDIRELTSGFFAGDEAIRTKDGEIFTKNGDRFHKQQSPKELLTRIILSSSKVGDFILDPFAGTGVTAIVSKQLNRNSISIELDPRNVELINKRLDMMRESDNIERFYNNYIYTENLDEIWYGNNNSNLNKAENYKLAEIPKVKLNDVFLMKETIQNVLINELNVDYNSIALNYRFKDTNNNIHRFELAVNINPKMVLIFRLVYAKTIEQADFWMKRIIYEKEMIEIKQPQFKCFVIISGIGFKNILKELTEDIKDHFLIAFPGWEKIFNLPAFVEKIKSIKILNNLQANKQVTLDFF